MSDRIHSTDTQQVRDQTPGPRATRGDADALGFDQVDNLGDSQEITRETEINDGAHLAFEALARLALISAYVPIRDRISAALQ